MHTRYILKVAIFLTLSILLSSTPSLAYVLGNSNLSLSEYDDPQCYPPTQPYNDDQYAWDMFQIDVNTYRQCIEEYIEGAQNDQERIQEKAEDAIQEFNSFINSIQY